jgi:hypothetical protein
VFPASGKFQSLTKLQNFPRPTRWSPRDRCHADDDPFIVLTETKFRRKSPRDCVSYVSSEHMFILVTSPTCPAIFGPWMPTNILFSGSGPKKPKGKKTNAWKETNLTFFFYKVQQTIVTDGEVNSGKFCPFEEDPAFSVWKFSRLGSEGGPHTKI